MKKEFDTVAAKNNWDLTWFLRGVPELTGRHCIATRIHGDAASNHIGLQGFIEDKYTSIANGNLSPSYVNVYEIASSCKNAWDLQEKVG